MTTTTLDHEADDDTLIIASFGTITAFRGVKQDRVIVEASDPPGAGGELVVVHMTVEQALAFRAQLDAAILEAAA